MNYHKLLLPDGALVIPCPTGQVSDGFHTFDELYLHRCILFFAVQKAYRELAWCSKLHSDGTMFDGWFVCGLDLPDGQVTYHMPNKLWELATNCASVLDKAPLFDGHTSDDVLARITSCIKGP
jgi:hypothetical protein